MLEIIQHYVNLPVPHFEHLEEGFVTYRYIHGEPLSRNALLKLSTTAQEGIISQLAIFFQQLHSIPVDVLAKANISTSDTVRSREDWLELYEQVKTTHTLTNQFFTYIKQGTLHMLQVLE